MNILHVIPGNANASGPSHVVARLAEETARRGHHVSICHLTNRGVYEPVPLGGQVDVLGFPAKGLRRWGYSPQLRRHLNKCIQEYDVVHCHSMWLFPNLAVYSTAKKSGVPFIIRPAGSLEPWCFNRAGGKKRAYLALVERRILNQASAIHAVSKQEADNIRTHGFSTSTFVIANGVNTVEVAQATDQAECRRRLGLPENRPLVLFLSRIHEKKGLDILGSAMVAVRKELPTALLAVAGPDKHEYASRLKRLYKELGLSDHAVFLGEVAGERKREAYRAADVFVLPTRSENFGVVVLEAMAEGLPVVVSQNAPWSVLERENAGFWVENDPQVIADRLLAVLTNSSLRAIMSKQALQLVKQRFSWSSIVDSLEGVYRDIIAGRDPNASLAEAEIS